MMKSNPIEPTPGNKFIILEDDRKHSDVSEVAQWSVERADRIRKDGEPSRIAPTHGLPLDHLPRHRQEGLRRSWPFGMYARRFAIAGLAMVFVPSFLGKPSPHYRFSCFNRSAGDIVLYALTAA
jgi:hypothetical protein